MFFGIEKLKDCLYFLDCDYVFLLLKILFFLEFNEIILVRVIYVFFFLNINRYLILFVYKFLLLSENYLEMNLYIVYFYFWFC